MRRERPNYIRKLIEFERSKIDDSDLRGFVLDVSDELTLLNLLTGEYALNGFTVIRNADVTRYSIYDQKSYFLNRVLQLKGIKPKRNPKVDIRNLRTALVSAQRRFPLLTIHPEQRDPGICYVGRIAAITDKTVTFHEIDPVAEWEGQRRHRLAEITRLDFGGAYEDALWRVAQEGGEIPPVPVQLR